MNNLQNAGLSLRTIQPGEYSNVIEDINYNFLQLLNLPGFRGRPGESIVGPPGPSTRGSKWCFARFENISAIYSSVTSADQINLQFFNINFADDPEKLFSSLYIPNDSSLIVGDLVVLPNGQIIELVVNSVSSNLEFVDTGITFSQVTQITEQRIIELINSIVQPSVSNDSFRHFSALAKNASDASPGMNNNLTQTAVIDPQTSTSGPGYPMDQYTFVAPVETNVTSLTQMLLVAGSIGKYHELVQGTQTDFTNEYAPSVESFAALAVLQNNYKNGIILGNKNETTFRNFARIYKDSDSLVLTSSYSPLDSQFSSIKISNSEILVRANSKFIVNAPTVDFSTVQNFISKHINYDSTKLNLGNVTTQLLELNAQTIRIQKTNLKAADILSTNADGDVVKTFSVTNTLSEASTQQQLLNAKKLYEIINGLQSSISDTNSTYKAIKRYRTGTYSVNNVSSFGIIAYAKEVNVTNLPQFSSGTLGPRPCDLFLVTQAIPDDANVPTANHITSYLQEIYIPKLVSINDINNTVDTTIGAGSEPPTLILGENAEVVWQRFIRFGTKKKDQGTTVYQINWNSMWTKSLTNYDRVRASNGLHVSGNFLFEDLTVKHNNKASTLTDSVNSGSSVIQSIRFDNYGHPRIIVVKDLAEEFIGREAELKSFNFKNNHTLVESTNAFNEINKTKQIQTNLIIVGDTNNNNVWISNNGSASNSVLGWNSLPLYHNVQYSYERISATQSLIYLRINYSPPGSGFGSLDDESWAVNFANHSVEASLVKQNSANTLASLKTQSVWRDASHQHQVQRLVTSDYPLRFNSSNVAMKDAVFLVSLEAASTQQFSILFSLNRYVMANSANVVKQN